MEQRGEYSAGGQVAPEVNEVCECGYLIGQRKVTYQRGGGWWVLMRNGDMIWNIDLTCPGCGKPWSYHARRKARQQAFE